MKLSNDKEEEDEVKPEEVKSEEMYGSMSKRNWHRYLAKGKKALRESGEVAQVEVIAKLLIGGEFDTMRMDLEVVEGKARTFLAANLSKLSEKQLRLRVEKLEAALLPSRSRRCCCRPY